MWVRSRERAGAWLAGIASIAACLAIGRRAAAESPPALPIAVDVSKVAVGSWAEYSVSGPGQAMTVRWAVVARGADGTTLEVSMPDAALAASKRTPIVQRITVAPEANEKAPTTKRAALQIGAADPLEVRARKSFAALDPRDKVGDEPIDVTAGHFEAVHYRQKTAQGTLDVWVASSAGPLGLVKLEMSFPATLKAKGTITVELARTGSDAKAAIVKVPLRFEGKTLAAVRTKLGITNAVIVLPVLPEKKP